MRVAVQTRPAVPQMEDDLAALREDEVRPFECTPLTHDLVGFDPDAELVRCDERAVAAIHAAHPHLVHYDPARFTHSRALAELGDVMLNADALATTWARLIHEGWPGQFLMMDMSVFVRPDSGLKAFPGQLAEAWVADPDAMFARLHQRGERVTPEQDVVVAPRREVLDEYRFVVVGGRPLLAGWYREGGRTRQRQGAPGEAWDFAAAVARTWLPDPCCVMDVARTPKGLHVVEFNCVDCSGFYAVTSQQRRALFGSLSLFDTLTRAESDGRKS